MLPSEFQKFNNNGQYQHPEFPAAHALSHFSYQLFGGRLMMVDIQGCVSPTKDRFTLTDPGFHTITGTGLGETNLGVKGFQRFFENHTCSDLCRQLNLQKPNLDLFNSAPISPLSSENTRKIFSQAEVLV
jgi:hypothetical protein